MLEVTIFLAFISTGSNNINGDFVVVIHLMFDIFVYLQVLPG